MLSAIIPIIKIIMSLLYEIEYSIGLISAVAPTIRTILKIFEPMTLPIAISISFLIVAVIEVINSGKLVLKATIVRPIIFSLIPKLVAIAEALSTTKSPPNLSPIIPTIILNIVLNKEIFSFLVLVYSPISLISVLFFFSI